MLAGGGAQPLPSAFIVLQQKFIQSIVEQLLFVLFNAFL